MVSRQDVMNAQRELIENASDLVKSINKVRDLIDIFANESGVDSFEDRRVPRPDLRNKPAPKSNGTKTPIICSQCGTQTTVPFVPKSQENLLCLDCLKKKRGKHDE